MHDRQNALNTWLEKILASSQFTLVPLAGDASFRRYFRLHYKGKTQVVMDAPPDKETIEPFLAIANLLSAAGINTPHIYAVNIAEGFAILDDFGDTLLLKALSDETADTLYKAAMNTLNTLQLGTLSTAKQLPAFDKNFILYELNVFKEWFLQAYLKIELSAEEEVLINQTFDWLSNEILQQPKVVIHRDYHSRNIMLLANSEPVQLGVIDFQDAMYGPFTYDLVSLLKDCYVQWPREQVMNWLTYFYQESSIAKPNSLPAFVRAFDYCGLQRHLKVLGVFSRLYLRDGKPNYLQDLPLTLHYVIACLECYEEFAPFYQFVQNRIHLP
ncbi:MULTISPECIES: aminoglycoside phosphotransferase family protein [Legionella]|uniref:Putative phosphotransferase n=1 Tax=Legionella drozanskii LLAP-1 TaxID=1212489 RepID=A0A0W0SQ79_9GAMM|nr:MULTISPECIES: phosphotransferase [Legionella]KTC85499.1 putative phosphotransferase [Legionella drozanskii LLAP-1]PJE18160.1 MAG: phosphotransferase [Legionella sp.]